MIRCVARVLAKVLARSAEGARLGHIGGDNFVIVATNDFDGDLVASICSEFDRERRELFEPSDLKRGYFVAVDRQGRTVNVPLVTLSVAVVQGEIVQAMEHPGALAQVAASLKRKVKETTAREGKSSFLFERRRFQSSESALGSDQPTGPIVAD